MRKLRPLGQVMCDAEPIIGDEMAGQHEMQTNEIVSLIVDYLDVHFPDARPTFTDGSRLVILMGHRDEVIKEALRLKDEVHDKTSRKRNGSRRSRD